MAKRVTMRFQGKQYAFNLSDKEYYKLSHKVDENGKIVPATEVEQREKMFKNLPLTMKQQLQGSFFQLQDVALMGKADELSGYLAAAGAAVRSPEASLRAFGALWPGGESPSEAYTKAGGESLTQAYQAEKSAFNDMLKAMKARYPVSSAIQEGVVGGATGAGYMKAAQAIGNIASKVPMVSRVRNLRPADAKEASQYDLVSRPAQNLSEFTSRLAGSRNPLVRQTTGKYAGLDTLKRFTTAATLGGAAAADYGYWSGEGGLPLERGSVFDEGGRRDIAVSALPWGVLFGVGLQTVPSVARGVGGLWNRFRGRQAAGPDLEMGYAKPEDYEAGARAIAEADLRDAMLAGVEGTTPRRGLIDDATMLADEGTFRPLLAHAATTAGGESVASAAARLRMQQRAEAAGTRAELGREVDVRGETARDLIDEATLKADTAYTGAERRPDRIPINTESQIHGDLMKSPSFDEVLTIAKKDRGDEPGVVGDYPNTKKELLGGYRNIDEVDVPLYEKKGWEVKVTEVEGARDPVTGEPGVPTRLYRAIDPAGPNFTVRQANEINKAFGTVLETASEKQSAGLTRLAKSFHGKVVSKSDALVQAGRRHEERLRLEGAAAENPSTLLALKPEELSLKLEFDGNVQKGFPRGKPRSADQQKILQETLWDDISRQVREAKGRPSQSLIDSVEVLMKDDKAGFTRWRDSVRNAEKYGLSWDNFGRAYDPKEDLPPSAAEAVGKVGRRMAEFFFSAPFAAARQLDRTLSKAQLLRNQAVNDAVVDMLTKTGPQRVKAERLIQKAMSEKTVSPADRKLVMEIFRMAVGLAPQMGEAEDMPYVGATGRAVGYGLIGAGRLARGLIPGVQ